MNCRELAVSALAEILDEGGYNNLVLKKIFKANESLTAKEKAFVTEIVNGTIRNLMFLDFLINQFSKTKTKKMKPLILNTLRISFYQINFMDSVPDSAICNEAVKLVKKKKFNNLAGFVNAIVRNMSRNKQNIASYTEKIKDKVEYLETLYSTPRWIIELWIKQFDFEIVEKICKANLEPPKIAICVNTKKTTKDELKLILEKEGIISESGILAKNSLYINKTKNITDSKAFKAGLFHVMDESSMLCSEALSLKSGKTLIDTCSAPGGKAFYCAHLMQNDGKILARDIHKHKIELIEDAAKRLGITIITTEILDATKENPSDFCKADYVLIDAPCSGLGILRKKPDAKYKKTKQDVKSLALLQKNILKACYRYPKIGGTLVYSTCTINAEENIQNVEWFCENYGYELESLEGAFSEKLACDGEISTIKKGYIQILPHMYNTDGFFIAKMKRKV